MWFLLSFGFWSCSVLGGALVILLVEACLPIPPSGGRPMAVRNAKGVRKFFQSLFLA